MRAALVVLVTTVLLLSSLPQTAAKLQSAERATDGSSVSSNFVFPPPVQLYSQLSLSNGTAVGAPVVLSGWAVVANSDSSIVGRMLTDLDQSSVWNITLSSAPSYSFGLSDNVTFVVFSNDTITALANNGTLLWQWQTLNNNASIDPYYELHGYSPVIVDGVMYVGSATFSDDETPCVVYGIDLSSGNTVFTAMSHGSSNHILDTDGTLLFVPSNFNENSIEAFYLANGTRLWRQSLTNPPSVAKVTSVGYVWVGSYYGGVSVFNKSTGAPSASVECKGDEVTMPIEEVSGVVYVFNGAYVNAYHSATLRIAFLPYTPNADDTITSYLFAPGAATLYIGFDSVVYELNTNNGRGSIFFKNQLVSGSCSAMVFLHDQQYLALSIGYMVIVEIATKAVQVAYQDCSVVGPVAVVPDVMGGLLVFGNSFAVPGWPMKSLYVLFNTQPGGSYWGLEQVYTANPPIVAGPLAYTFDTNNMYAIDYVAGAYNWTWTYPYMDAMVTSYGMYLTPNQEYLVAPCSMGSIFVSTANQSNVQSNASTSYTLVGNAVGDLIYGFGNGVTVVDTTTMATVMNIYNDSGDVECNTPPVAVGSTHVAVVCKGRLRLYVIAPTTSVPSWEYDAGKGIDFTAPPIVLPSKVIVIGSSDGKVVALTPSRATVVWSVNVIDPPANLFYNNNDSVVIATQYGMAMVQATTGALIWHNRKFVISGHQLKSEIHLGNGVLVSRGLGSCYGVNATSGQLIWTQLPFDFASYGDTAAVFNDKVFLTPMGSYAVGYDLLTGNVVFRVDVQGQCTGVVVGGSVVMLSQSPTDSGDNEIIGVTMPSFFL